VSPHSYADAFGAQWNRYRKTQLDSYTGLPLSCERLRGAFGEALWGNLRGKYVLEAGCGAGRFTEILLEEGAYVASIDISSAVEANATNFPPDERHRVAQADILTLPFAQQQFDFALCLGVIQHTPQPASAIKALAAQVRRAGWLIFDQYTHNLSALTKLTEPILRAWLKRLSPDDGIKWTERLVKILLPLHKSVRRIYPAQALLSRVSPVRCYYHEYPSLDEVLQREWAMLDTHDALTRWYAHKSTCRDVVRLLRSLGFDSINCERDGVVIVARARRP
jgi:SAM-dependent methyltransferase